MIESYFLDEEDFDSQVITPKQLETIKRSERLIVCPSIYILECTKSGVYNLNQNYNLQTHCSDFLSPSKRFRIRKSSDMNLAI